MTDVAGNAEVIEDNISGFVAAAPTVSALDEALERSWQRSKEWKEIGEVAAQRIRKLVPRDPAREFARELQALLPEAIRGD